MTRIKICGITNLEDARAALDAGADALGFVFASSPRQISPEAAREIARNLPPFVCRVGVFMNATLEFVRATAECVGLDACQLHGDEPPDYCGAVVRPVIKRLDVSVLCDGPALRAAAATFRVAALLLDPGAGSGRPFDWSIARGLSAPIIVAGGLTHENVAAAIRAVRPYAVDVASGVESSPGRKDSVKMHRFIQAVRSADGCNAAQ